jgi:outer membrane lipoprotein SlyB
MEAALRTALPAVLLACAAVGCAPAPPPPSPAPEPVAGAPEPAPARLGTIVAIRPIGPVAARAAEFVVREDSGTTIVVVQPHTDVLAVGERVALHAETRTRITRTR